MKCQRSAPRPISALLSLLLLSIFFSALPASSSTQPFLENDYDAVHSDALIARYLIAHQNIFSVGSNPMCPTGTSLPDQSCSAAIHRFCWVQGYATGFGFTSPDDSSMVEITCLASGAGTVQTLDYPSAGGPNQARIDRWCMHPTHKPSTPNLHCSVGIDRYCAANGYGGGFGPVERSYGGQVKFVCLDQDVVSAVTGSTDDLLDSTVCDGLYGAGSVPDACSQAMADYCEGQNRLGGYGPGEASGTSIKIGCLLENEPWTANSVLPETPAEPVDIVRWGIEEDSMGGISLQSEPSHNTLAAATAQTFDGRVVFGATGRKGSVGPKLQLYMQMPEVFVAPLSQEQQGDAGPVLRQSDPFKTFSSPLRHVFPTAQTPLTSFHGSSSDYELASSMAVCDLPDAQAFVPHLNETQSVPSREGNPYRCDANGVASGTGVNDCYDVTLVLRFSDTTLPTNQYDDELWATPFQVVVASPKENPHVIGGGNAPYFVTHQVLPTGQPQKLQVGSGHQILEPVITGNGRLLIAQVDGFIQYSVIKDQFGPCSAANWGPFKHISEMYADPDMANYGLAKFPLRDVQDQVISVLPGETPITIRGAYPWVDRDGDNLFFMAADQASYYIDDNDQIQERFTITGHPFFDKQDGRYEEPTNFAELLEPKFSGGVRLGLSFVGLWSQGKLSTPDSRNNNADVAVFTDDDILLYRTLELYQGPDVELGGTTKVTLSSPENQFNHLPNVLPETPREVVWHVATQGDTDEIAFDDVNHPRAFIVSDMTAPLAFQGRTRNRYLDGFEWNYSGIRDVNGDGTVGDQQDVSLFKFQGRGFTRAPLVANTASAVSEELVDFAAAAHAGSTNPLAGAAEWNVPTYGRLLGGARTEPVAAGGFQAKGVWLDGDDWVEYLIKPQPAGNDMATSPWFVTLSLEPSLDGGTSWWRLITWPDGSYLDAKSNGQEIRMGWAVGSPTTIPLNGSLALEDGKWSSIAVLSEVGAPNQVSVFVDGLRIAVIDDAANQQFRMETGDMRVGASANGLKGWIDDFKVIGAEPTFEEVCNHAGGTLMGFDNDGQTPSAWISLASTYSVGLGNIHTDLSAALAGLGADYEYYACERPKTFVEDEVCLGKTHGPMPASCLRPALHLLGQPLIWNESRPDSVTNVFCLSCHTESNPSGTMRPSEALIDLHPLTMHEDTRRQPLQTFPFLYGGVPNDYFGPGDPGVQTGNPIPPINLDERVHPD